MSTVEIILCLVIFVSTFLFMEGVAWFTHKYVMHGFLWVWHKSHHKVHSHTLELNDLFALMFALPSFLLIYFNAWDNLYLVSAGFGIAGYGLFYFLFHDVIVHQRIKWRPQNRGNYLNRMINAHYIHHKTHTKHKAEAFGFLYAPKKFEARKKE